ncbi:MAG: helix-turn-helix domain-containing protein, partial [Desulfoferrobacter sp.]
MPERNKLRTHAEEVKNERLFITSLARGLSLLESLADSGAPLTLTQLARATGFTKATLTRFCHTLAELGYIEKTARKRYQLTPKILGLGYGVICGYDLCQVAKPYLRELSRTLGETVNMA